MFVLIFRISLNMIGLLAEIEGNCGKRKLFDARLFHRLDRIVF